MKEYLCCENLFFKKNFSLSLFIYFERESESEHEQGRVREKKRERIPSRLCADSADVARTHRLQDHDLTRNQASEN